MADLEKDHPEKDHQYSEFAQLHAAAEEEESEQHQIPVVRMRLRDRELLRKRKAEAQEKETFQWVLGNQNKHKRQRKGRGTGRGRGICQTKELETEAQPEAQEENGQDYVEHEEEPDVKMPGAYSEMVEDVPEESTAHTAHREVPEIDPEPETSDVLNLPLDNPQEDEFINPLF